MGRPLDRAEEPRVAAGRGALPGPSGAWDDGPHVRRAPQRHDPAVGARRRPRWRPAAARKASDPVDRTDTTPGNGAQTQTIPPDLQLPPNVPLRATGPASPASTRVIRRWLAALDRGDLLRAAHFFALPSKFQNSGTPVLHIDNEDERIAVNLSLTLRREGREDRRRRRLHDRRCSA